MCAQDQTCADCRKRFVQLRLSACVPLDGRERVLDAVGRERLVAQHRAPAEHGVQRRPQLVREDREELVFHAIRLIDLLGKLQRKADFMAQFAYRDQNSEKWAKEVVAAK